MKIFKFNYVYIKTIYKNIARKSQGKLLFNIISIKINF